MSWCSAAAAAPYLVPTAGLIVLGVIMWAANHWRTRPTTGEPASAAAGSPPSDEPAAIRSHLHDVLSSRTFAESEKLRSFLRLVVERMLERRGISEGEIARQLFGFDKDGFDSKRNRNVANTASRLREKLREYYETEGKGAPFQLTIPKGGYVVELQGLTHRPTVTARKSRTTREIAVAAIPAAVVAVVALLSASARNGQNLCILGLREGAAVSPFEDIVVNGGAEGMHHYLVVEPLDNFGKRWVQGEVGTTRQTIRAQFGDGLTPTGMRFRVYTLSTRSVLPVGFITYTPGDANVTGQITVVLRKP